MWSLAFVGGQCSAKSDHLSEFLKSLDSITQSRGVIQVNLLIHNNMSDDTLSSIDR